MSNQASLQSATNVAFESATEQRLSSLGATNVVRASDRLILGPSRRDSVEHARARQAWWNSSEEWDQLYSPHVHWDLPIILWVSASIAERVNLWRTCSWFRQMGIAHKDVLILEFDAVPPRSAPEEPLPSFDCSSSVAHHSDAVLLKRLAQAHPFSKERYDHAVYLWELYTDPNPLPLFENCMRGVDGFPEVGSLWAFLSNFFPRTSAEGALRLSRFDELLLTILSEQWKTPVSVFVHPSEAGALFRQLASGTGDLFVRERLDQWTNHGSNAAVEREANPNPKHTENPMLSSVYRISQRGIQLRDAGLAHLTDAPSLPIAGTVAYADSTPWVVQNDSQLAQFAANGG